MSRVSLSVGVGSCGHLRASWPSHARCPAQCQALHQCASLSSIALLPVWKAVWCVGTEKVRDVRQPPPGPSAPRTSPSLPGLPKRQGFSSRNFCAGKKASFAMSSESSCLAML